jgi:hypothetical protein
MYTVRETVHTIICAYKEADKFIFILYTVRGAITQQRACYERTICATELGKLSVLLIVFVLWVYCTKCKMWSSLVSNKKPLFFFRINITVTGGAALAYIVITTAN